MVVQPDLSGTWSDTRRPVFSQRGSNKHRDGGEGGDDEDEEEKDVYSKNLGTWKSFVSMLETLNQFQQIAKRQM